MHLVVYAGLLAPAPASSYQPIFLTPHEMDDRNLVHISKRTAPEVLVLVFQLCSL